MPVRPIKLDIHLEGERAGLKFSEFVKVCNQLTKDSGESVADAALERLRYLLAPRKEGGTQNIGSTGAASRNFVKTQSKKKDGMVTWEISEGNTTPANKLIREGIPSGTKVPLDNLRLWALLKGIKLYHPQEAHNTAVMKVVSAHTRVSKSGKISDVNWYFRSKNITDQNYKKFTGKQITDAALSAIRNAIQAQGTERPNANWTNKYPYGEGRFDYVSFALNTNREYFNNAVMNASEDALAGIIDYISTGRIRKGRRGKVTFTPYR